MTSRLFVLAGGLVLVGALVFFFARGGFTPITTAYVLNDTAATVTLENCEEIPVPVAPGTREKIAPFEDAAHSDCVVFAGNSDAGRPIGCLHVPSHGGHTIRDALALVSQMQGAPPPRCRT